MRCKDKVLGLLVVSLLLPAASAAATRGPAIAVLVGFNGSRAHGAATVTQIPHGTRYTLQLAGLRPAQTVRVILSAGTCQHPSASSAVVGNLTADRKGYATSIGNPHFPGTLKVPMAVVADNSHVITLVSSGRVVACGTVTAA